MQSDKMQKITNALFEILLADKGISGLTDRISELFDCSVVVVGADLQYLAYNILDDSDRKQDALEAFKKEMENGYMSSAVLEYTAKHHLSDIAEKEGICCHYMESFNMDIWLCPVRIRRIAAAKLVLLIEHTDASQKMNEYLPLLAGAVSQELQKRQQVSVFGHTPVSAFLFRILDNPKMQPSMLEEMKMAIQPKLKDKFYVVVLEAENGELRSRDMETLLQLLQRFMRGIEYTAYEGRLVVLLNFSKDGSLSRYMMKNLKQFAISNSLRVGISNVFADIREFQRFYEQAHRAIRLGLQHLKNSSLTPVYLYYDYSYCDLVENCSDSVNLLDIVYPPLLELLEYDRQKDSNLMDTLFQYLLHNANTQLTAQSMSTHKNTILYRLNLIKEIIQNDLSAGENLFIINLSLRIMTHLRLFVPQRVTDKYDMASPNLDIED